MACSKSLSSAATVLTGEAGRPEGAVSPDGQILGRGSYVGDNITLGFQDFHSANLSSRSSYVLEPKGVVLPDFAAYALGGSVKGRDIVVVVRGPDMPMTVRRRDRVASVRR